MIHYNRLMKTLMAGLLLIALPASASDSQVCYEAICGSSSAVRNYAERFLDDYKKPTKDSEYLESLSPLIKKYIDKEQAIWSERHKFLEEVHGRPDLLLSKASPLSIFISSAIGPILDNFNKLYEKGAIETLNFASVMIFFNEAKAREVLKDDYSPEELEWVLKLNKEFYRDNKYGRILIYALSKAGLPQYTFNSISNDHDISIFQAIHDELDVLNSQINLIDTSVLPPFDQEYVAMMKDRVGKASMMEEVPEFITEKINTSLFLGRLTVNYYLSLQDGFMDIMKTMPASLINRELEKITNLNPANFDPKLVNPISLFSIKKTSLKVCQEMIGGVLNISPSEDDIRKLPRKLREIKERSVEFSEKHFGKFFADFVKEQLNRLQYDIPASKEFLMGYVKDQFLTETNKPAGYYFSEMAMMDGDLFSPDESGSVFSLGLKDICNPITPELKLDDKIYAAGSRPLMNISSTTIKHFNDFQFVISHEVGHLIYDLLKGARRSSRLAFVQSQAEVQKIEEKLTCVSSGNTNAPTTVFTINMDINRTFAVNQYTSEDFADVFAATISDKNVPNTFCFMLNRDENKRFIFDLNNTDPADPHSANFYRILNIEKNLRGSIPESCERVLNSEPHLKVPQCFM